MRTLAKIAVLCFLLSGLGRVGFAQTTGAVQGTVTDPQEAPLAGAQVELVRTATNVSTKTQTTGAGSYLFDFVTPGGYVLTVSAPGFKASTVRNVLVEASRTPSVNVRLEVGRARLPPPRSRSPGNGAGWTSRPRRIGRARPFSPKL